MKGTVLGRAAALGHHTIGNNPDYKIVHYITQTVPDLWILYDV